MGSSAVVAAAALLLVACAGVQAAPGPAGDHAGPLTATFGGRPFQPRGVIATRDGNAIQVRIYDRAAACNTPSASDLANERYFLILLKPWPMAASGAVVDAHAAGIGLNAMKSDGGGGGSSSSLDGELRVTSSTATDGSIIIHARGADGTLDGELSFALCS